MNSTLLALMALATTPTHPLPPAQNGGVVVGLCDGETTVETAKAPTTRPEGQAVSDQLMTDWKTKNPNANWDAVKVAAATPPSGTAAAPPSAKIPEKASVPSGSAGHTYGAFTARDEAVWKASIDETIADGKAVFHDAKRLGGTVAISCDMCHPDASNTHPETYPKYQVQLGRVALLRDMINWCIENPVRGQPLAEDDPRMKAMEAYIYSQRKGVALEYGKH
jgi:thiosulfate dehydrogenase